MKKRQHRINNEIRASKVRLVQMDPEDLNGVMTLRDALKMASERELDLVEINSKGQPPVVRIVDYNKFIYEQEKNKTKQPKVSFKEIKLGPNIGDHDLNFRVVNAKKFVAKGHKLKVTLQFRGRNIVHKDRGFDVINKFAEELNEVTQIEMKPILKGKKITMILKPKR